MSTLESLEQTIGSSLTVRGAKRTLLVSGTEDNLRPSENLSRVLLAAAREFALELLDDPSRDRGTERLLGHAVVARRFIDFVVCVIGDESLDENEVQRKLNVLAIKFQVAAARQPPNEIVTRLREAYIGCTMPLSGRIFDRIIDDLKRAQRPLDAATLRPVMETLARTLTPPANEDLLKHAEKILTAHESAPPPNSVRSTSTRSSRPAPTQPHAQTPSNRPQTIPVMAAVQQVARRIAGPLGDLLVQQALETIPVPAAGHDISEKLLEAIALQLPVQARMRFISEGRAAVDAATRDRR
jgi:hypothetical protein